MSNEGGTPRDGDNPFVWKIARVDGDETDTSGTLPLSHAAPRTAPGTMQDPSALPPNRAAQTYPPTYQQQVAQQPLAHPAEQPQGRQPTPNSTLALFAAVVLTAFSGGCLASNAILERAGTNSAAEGNGLSSAASDTAAVGSSMETTDTSGTTDGSGGDGAGSEASSGSGDGTGEPGNGNDGGLAVLAPFEQLNSVPPTEENPTGAVRYAIFRDGTATLRGFARDQESIDRLVASFGTAFGASNVINEYELNPAAPTWTDAPIYFGDAVLFDLGSAQIRPGFYPLMESTARLIELGPFVSVTVVARTDASGSAESNQQLAQRRADAVVDFFVDELGIERFRFSTEILGEQGATPEAGDEVAATERRVDLVISGLRG